MWAVCSWLRVILYHTKEVTPTLSSCQPSIDTRLTGYSCGCRQNINADNSCSCIYIFPYYLQLLLMCLHFRPFWVSHLPLSSCSARSCLLPCKGMTGLSYCKHQYPAFWFFFVTAFRFSLCTKNGIPQTKTKAACFYDNLDPDIFQAC